MEETSTDFANRINFVTIAMQPARDYKIRTIQSEIKRIGGIDKVLITDCLSNKDRDGLLVMRVLNDALSNNPTVRYKIRVLKDLWGKPMLPGDLLEWKVERKVRDMFGKKITNRQFKEYVRRGEQREIEIWHSAEIDSKGCVDVGFTDAGILLDTRGVHFVSGQPLTTMPELAKEMTRDSYDKEYAKVIGRQHFWLYSEAPPWIYETMPTVKKPKKKEPLKETKEFNYATEV